MISLKKKIVISTSGDSTAQPDSWMGGKQRGNGSKETCYKASSVDQELGNRVLD